jgi:hypothetical protein
MKKTQNKIFKSIYSLLFLIFIGISLASCEATKEFSETNSKLNKRNNSITFEQFKNETNQHEFKTKIKINSNPNRISSKNANGSYELSDFDISTEIIKRLELNDKITYSFRIYPTVIVSPKSIYNLVLQNKDGQWFESVLEFKPTLENYEKVISGINDQIEGKVSLLYASNADEIISTGTCHKVEIVNIHCNGLGICTKESCDGCNGCVEKQYATFCLNNNSLSLGNETDIINETVTIDSNNNPENYSLIANINDLKKQTMEFAQKHVLLGNQIIKLIDAENNLNFDDFPYDQLDLSQNLEQFKQALVNTGMVNYEQIYDLILLQNQNASEFISKNKDFTTLQPQTRNLIITNSIEVAITNNPIIFTQPSLPTTTTTPTNDLKRTCYEQYVIDRQDCADDALINSGIVFSGCWFATPAACAIGYVGVLAIAANCSQRAKRAVSYTHLRAHETN